jgi:hypothetical protein
MAKFSGTGVYVNDQPLPGNWYVIISGKDVPSNEERFTLSVETKRPEGRTIGTLLIVPLIALFVSFFIVAQKRMRKKFRRPKVISMESIPKIVKIEELKVRDKT